MYDSIFLNIQNRWIHEDRKQIGSCLELGAVKNWLTGKDPETRKDWRQEEKGVTEDKMVGWHYQLDGLEFQEAPGAADEQGSLVYYRP